MIDGTPKAVTENPKFIRENANESRPPTTATPTRPTGPLIKEPVFGALHAALVAKQKEEVKDS